jgi:hypothetical protein
MPLLLTILSVLAFWAFLQLLIFGLYFIYKSLQATRVYLEKITFGVRAIERQSRPLREQGPRLISAVEQADTRLHRLKQQLSRVDANLAKAAPRLKPPRAGLLSGWLQRRQP